MVDESLIMFRETDQQCPGSPSGALLVPLRFRPVRRREGLVGVRHRRRGHWTCQFLLGTELGDEQ